MALSLYASTLQIRFASQNIGTIHTCIGNLEAMVLVEYIRLQCQGIMFSAHPKYKQCLVNSLYADLQVHLANMNTNNGNFHIRIKEKMDNLVL